jgi:hypothetical protein
VSKYICSKADNNVVTEKNKAAVWCGSSICGVVWCGVDQVYVVCEIFDDWLQLSLLCGVDENK